jgi:hypothetical protein
VGEGRATVNLPLYNQELPVHPVSESLYLGKTKTIDMPKIIVRFTGKERPLIRVR